MHDTMKKITPYLLIPIFSLLSAWVGWKAHEQQTDLASTIYKANQIEKVNEAWGDIQIYTPENGTGTYGTINTLTAVADIDAGQEIHPPHQHTAEEFMYILEGNGTWSLNGKEQPAEAGDLLYAKPWDWHGIKNTGDKPLKFFVVKWDNKGLPMPINQGK